MSQIVTFTHEGKDFLFRRPRLGNKDDISFQRVNRKTRGGDLILFRDEQWPKTEVLDLTFDFDTDVEGHRLLQFIRATTGTNVYYRDHENRLWYGVIQNPDTELVAQGRFTFAVQILFEGDLA